jgi:uncharacterized protein (DUF1015 family)
MAQVFPFAAYRYGQSAGPLDRLVTQPYDKISPAMKERYLSLSPHNLVRVILEKDYAMAAQTFHDWIAGGILVQDAVPAFYAYFQEFRDPDSGERLLRKGFIGAGQVEEYEAGIVHRHEKTLSGPKKDRLEVLRHTRAHFGQIFMLYPDPEGEVDRIIDEAAGAPALCEVADEYGAVHRLWPMSDRAKTEAIQSLMGQRKLVIADGHHRYETALNFRNESPLADARRVMMTFVNMHSSGLRILATHRLVSGLGGFDPAALLTHLGALGQVTVHDAAGAKARLAVYDPARIRMGIVLAGQDRVSVLDAPRAGALDVGFLHAAILERALGIGEEAVREERYLRYVRGIDAALDAVQSGAAQVGFLLQPTRIEEVADVSFGGGVMPQKSTDFYPKLLSGMAIYRLER